MARGELFEENLTHSVIGAFYEVYNNLGFGFLEHLYVMAMERELIAREHQVGREVCVRVMYKGEELAVLELGLLLHFGPRPNFHRVICRNTDAIRSIRRNPEHPHNPPS